MRKLTALFLLLSSCIPALAEECSLVDGNIILDFTDRVEAGSFTAPYTVSRSLGRFGQYGEVATVSDSVYADTGIAGNPYDYYYLVHDSQGLEIGLLSLEIELFGPNVYIFSPSDDPAAVSGLVNQTSDQMQYAQFSANRYAFFFKPGDYTGAGKLRVSFYTHIGGLGKLPYDTQLSNIFTPGPLSDNNATQTFWRSAENFAVSGPSNDDIESWFTWAVSQAAPLRRVYSEKRAHFQLAFEGWCSGGYTGDCYFEDAAGSFSQQQWYFRNTYIEKGSEGYSAGGWNLAYQGVEFGPYVNMALHSDNWNTSGGVWNNVSRVDTTPVVREKPFLFLDESDGRYKVFRPGLRHDSKGVSWGPEDMGQGTVHDLLDEFFVAKPGATAEELNAQLDVGRHLFFTPGLYYLSEPLRVKFTDTIILGTGYATLIPGESNPEAAIIIDDVGGVTIASLLFDACYSSTALLRAGPADAVANHSENPTLLADLFFRVGGFLDQAVNVDTALVINSSDVIGDHFWIWRADHGAGVGWNLNTSRNGLIVNGDYVTIYGLFNEHFQEYQTIWNGEHGALYFLQCETPYDVPSQSAYMSHDGSVKGYAAYKVGDHVRFHQASMMGIYDVFIRTGRAEIAIESSIEVPDSPGIRIHHACNVNISTKGGFNYVINGQVPSTFNLPVGTRRYIVDFAGAPGWAGYPVGVNGFVDTDPWLGLLYVEEAPYVWSLQLDCWLYADEAGLTEEGGWVYVFRPARP